MLWLRWELMASKILYNLPDMGRCLCSCSGPALVPSVAVCGWVPGGGYAWLQFPPAPSLNEDSPKRTTISRFDSCLPPSPWVPPQVEHFFLGLLWGASPQQLPRGAPDTMTSCSPICLFPCLHMLCHLPSSLLATVTPASLLPPFGRTYLRKCRQRTQLCSCTSPKPQEPHPHSPRNSPVCSDPLQRECWVRQSPFLLGLRLGKPSPGWRCRCPFLIGR